MAWWSRLFERRSWTLRELHSWRDIGLTEPTAAGVTVSAQSALSVPAVFACVQVLAQDVARTPIRFKEQVAPDTFEDATDHPLSELLGSLPNPETTSYEFQFAMMWQLLCHGRAYAEIIRTDNRVEALWPLVSDYMTVDRTPAGSKRWTYRTGGEPHTWVFDPSMPPILEVKMETPMLRCREAIASALALQAYVGQFFANGARPTGILQVAGAINDATALKLRDQWKGIFSSGGTNRRGVAVLDSGAEFKPIASENDSAQLNETQRALNEQICGVFRVPTSKIGDLSKSNYSNMQVSEQVYVTSTLDPFYRSLKLAFKRDLLTSRQFHHYTATFDRSALTRNDTKALHDSLCQGIQNGIYSQNDARRKLGENPIEGGDVYMVNTALAPFVGRQSHVA